MEKANKLLWCLGEEYRQLLAERLRAAVCINVLRDERHARLHIRVRGVPNSGEVFSGFLGQARAAGQTALDICNATEAVFRRACTVFRCPPPGSQVEPQFDQALFEHVRHASEAITIDSAANECAAGADAYRAVRGGEPFLPNCRFTLHDSAHKARRILSRPWATDEVMDAIVQLFVSHRDSLSQLVHHSHDLKRLYQVCCTEAAVGDTADAAVSAVFGNLRSAKHRIESLATPLSRQILNLSGMLLFAVRLSVKRHGEREGRAADTFLRTLHVRILILAAMMADGGQESLHLIREMDQETMSTTDVNISVGRFLDRIAWLFHEDGALSIPGHTSYVLQWLRQPHFLIVDSAGKRIGGEPVAREELDDAFGHMRKWTCLAKEVLAAEFPNFDLINAFAVFALPERAKAPPTDDDSEVRLRRLAQAFRAPDFPAEFRAHWYDAWSAHKRAGKSNTYAQAWLQALNVRRPRPCSALRAVVLRYCCFAGSTSRIEQSFSKIAHVLGQQRLNAQEDSEERSIALLLFDAEDLNCNEDQLVERARAVWAEAFLGECRTHRVRRVDHGGTRASAAGPAPSSVANKPSERQFRKEAHEAVCQKARAGAATVLDVYRAADWSEGHAREQAFQAQKRQKRLVEALRRFLRFLACVVGVCRASE